MNDVIKMNTNITVVLAGGLFVVFLVIMIWIMRDIIGTHV